MQHSRPTCLSGGPTAWGRRCRSFLPLVALLVLAPHCAQAATFNLTTNADHDDGSCDTNDCTLREAINAANASPDASNGIQSGAATFSVVSSLPPITREMSIAPTSGGYLTINGSSAGSGANGLVISPSGYAHLGKVRITGFSGNGVLIIDDGVLEMLNNCQIDRCTLNGVLSNTSASSLGGGAVVAHDSSVSLCGGYGFALGGTFARIRHCSVFSNASGGIHLFDGASDAIIDGQTQGTNYIYNNGGPGIFMEEIGPTISVVTGTVIGLSATGAYFPNNGDGILLKGTGSVTIGGTTAGLGNTLVANAFAGLSIIAGGNGSYNNVAQGNFIGCTAAGNAVGNSHEGVFISASGNTIGGTVAGARNYICANQLAGVAITNLFNVAESNVIQGNYIGIAPGGAAMGNQREGVYVSGSSFNKIGGAPAGAGNVISANGLQGVTVTGTLSGFNEVRGNRIFSNGGLGIDLGGNGVTANDSGDGDTGANDLQNYPVLTSATTTSSTATISGTLNSTPNQTFTLDFYRNSAADPSSFGEGQITMAPSGSTSITTNSSGDASFTFSFTIGASIAGQFIAATATNSGNTSEFSKARIVSGAPTLSVNNPRSLPEGSAAAPGSVTFDITLSKASTQTVTVNYQTANGINNPAIAGSDYVAKSGKLTFAPGETLKRVTIFFIGDSVVELNETFFFDLKTPTNATIADSRGVGQINNDDGPGITINNAVTINEGNSGTKPQTFTVSLSAASPNTVTVAWTTANGTATTSDYVAASGTLTFTSGQTSKTITIQVKGDTTVEPNETYKVNLSKVTYAFIADGQGIGTIRNDDAAALLFQDDAPPTLSINNDGAVSAAQSAPDAESAAPIGVFASVSASSIALSAPGAPQDAAAYVVTVNGVATKVTGVDASDDTVTLLLADGALKAGDLVVVAWDGGTAQAVAE